MWDLARYRRVCVGGGGGRLYFLFRHYVMLSDAILSVTMRNITFQNGGGAKFAGPYSAE